MADLNLLPGEWDALCQEIDDMMEEGRIEVTCEFCRAAFVFTAADFDQPGKPN